MAADEPASKRRRGEHAAGDGTAVTTAASGAEKPVELSIGAAALAASDAAASRTGSASATQPPAAATAATPATPQLPCSGPTSATADAGSAPASISGEPDAPRLIRLPGREVNPQRARLWQQLKSDSVLFDVTLTASDREVHCNRFVLAEESCFFEKQFHSPEFARSNNAIDLKAIDGATLLAVVGSLFTAHLAVAPGSIDAILQCADMLQLPVVKAACSELISESLNEQTVPQALKTALKYELAELRQAVMNYTKNTFFLMHRTSLEAVDRATLLEILSADDLIVFSEMQVFRAIVAWVELNKAADEFVPLFTGTMRLWHLQPFEARSLLAEVLVKQHPAASAAITEALLNRLEGSRPLSSAPKRDSRRFVWAIDGWSDKRRQKAVRSPHFGLAGSERTWSLSYTSDKAGFHLTCVGSEDEDGEHIPYSPLSGEEAGEAVQLTMVLYH
eukprot:CAMPEP_0206146860 /NCGR_PEP_ID=MMETSP1473-20131121/31617_1 /ASSEMBLY_ACC=CAM_ASM_001109 /TAXON_ID=1461547 /ORGANISM="Stichococcus sp, Strain RCC1054" /LENGTH=448 /DNA_ID=CAMNT_0053543571 /DNA_START=232 /DNA_END=1575 /DNA_ORIENTATION=-